MKRPMSLRVYFAIDAALFVMITSFVVVRDETLWLLVFAVGFYINGLLTGARFLLACLEEDLDEGINR